MFIEDAIEETQVITSGVSAEFGRFGGGVINAITKRGGNEFSGSFRTDFTNPSWRDETPFEDEAETERESRLGKVFQATLGGPIVKDRLWFFVAGRKENRNTQGTFPFSGVNFLETRDDKRLEAKLTATVRPNHTVQGVYTTNRTSDAAPTFDFSIAPSTNDVTEFPQSLLVFNYSGVLRSNLFLEAQYSQQGLGFRDGNGTDTNLATGSPIFTFGNSAAVEAGQHYNAPYFDYGTDPQDRDNRQFTTSLSYFLSTASLGRHDLKGGFEFYRSKFKGGNSQSPTSFVYYADYKTNDAGDPVLDANGNLTPVFIPGGGLLLNWLAERGAVLNVNTTTLYLNDRWTLNNHWSFNLGLRFEQVRSDTTSPSISGIDTTTLVPRLGVDFDPTGSGRFKLQGTYSHYAASYNPGQFGNNQGAGNPSLVYGIYIGPEGEGLDFAPGFDPAELRAAERVAAHRQRLLRGRPVLAAGEGVDALRGHPDRRQRPLQGDLREPLGGRLRGGLHHLRPRDGRGDDAVHVPGLRGSVPARPLACTGTATCRGATTRRSSSAPAIAWAAAGTCRRTTRTRSATTATSRARTRTSRRSRPTSATTPRSWCPSATSPKAG